MYFRKIVCIVMFLCFIFSKTGYSANNDSKFLQYLRPLVRFNKLGSNIPNAESEVPSKKETILNADEVAILVAEGGKLLRGYLDSLKPDADNLAESTYGNLAGITGLGIEINNYAQHPEEYTDEALVQKGEDYMAGDSNKTPRIEVRKAGADIFQVAIVGIPNSIGEVEKADGEKEKLGDNIISQLVKLPISNDLSWKKGGFMSQEATRIGVNKGLPIKYLSRHFDEILDMMGYTPGSSIDASKTRTVLAVDFDGTMVEVPQKDKDPVFKDSKARDGVLAYLEQGGLLFINSANSNEALIRRFADDLPENLRNRVIVGVMGGPSITIFDPKNSAELIGLTGYKDNALEDVKEGEELDIVYIDDDGRPTGHAIPGYEAVGYDRAITVSSEPIDKVHSSLKTNYVGDTVSGTAKIIGTVVDMVMANPGERVFSSNNIRNIVASVKIDNLDKGLKSAVYKLCNMSHFNRLHIGVEYNVNDEVVARLTLLHKEGSQEGYEIQIRKGSDGYVMALSTITSDLMGPERSLSGSDLSVLVKQVPGWLESDAKAFSKWAISALDKGEWNNINQFVTAVDKGEILPAKFEENIHQILDDKAPGIEETIVTAQKEIENRIVYLERKLITSVSKENREGYVNELQGLQDEYTFVMQARKKVEQLGWPMRHCHTGPGETENYDDGRYSGEKLVNIWIWGTPEAGVYAQPDSEYVKQGAVFGGLTVGQVTPHDVMEGNIAARKYAETIPDKVVTIRPAVELDATITPKVPGVGAFMHFLVMFPDDPSVVEKAHKFVREFDGRLQSYLWLRFDLAMDMGTKEGFEKMVADVSEQEIKDIVKENASKLISEAEDITKVKETLYSWFKELKKYVDEHGKPRGGKRFNNEMDVIGIWTKDVFGSENYSNIDRAMRALLTIAITKSTDLTAKVEKEKAKLCTARQMAEELAKLGAIVDVAHPQADIGVFHNVTVEQYIDEITLLVKDGLIRGYGRGWWKGAAEESRKWADVIRKKAGVDESAFREVFSNSDFHDGINDHTKGGLYVEALGGWAEPDADKELFYEDGKLLVEKGAYHKRAEEAVSKGELQEALILLNIAKSTDPYNPETYKLIGEIYDIIRGVPVLDKIDRSNIKQFVTAVDNGEILPAEFSENIHHILNHKVPGIEKLIVTAQKKIENRIVYLERKLMMSVSKEDRDGYVNELQSLQDEYTFVMHARKKVEQLGWPMRHCHTGPGEKENWDDGQYSAEELVNIWIWGTPKVGEYAQPDSKEYAEQGAVFGGLTVGQVTPHDVMEGNITARKYAETITDKVVRIRPAVELSAVVTLDVAGVGSFMHFLVTLPDDPSVVEKAHNFVKDFDSRFQSYLWMRFDLAMNMGTEEGFEQMVSNVSEQEIKDIIKVNASNLISETEDITKVKETLYSWFKELKEYVDEHGKPRGGQRLNDQMDVIGNWTREVFAKESRGGEDWRNMDKAMRALLTIAITKSHDLTAKVEKEKAKLCTARQMAEELAKLGAIVDVAHPEADIDVFHNVTVDQYIGEVALLVKDGLIRGYGRGWWKGAAEKARNWADAIREKAGVDKSAFREVFSNADFHGEGDHTKGGLYVEALGGWAEPDTDKELFYVDGRLLVEKGAYHKRAEEAVSKGDLQEALILLNIAKSTDPYNPETYKLIGEVYNIIREVSASNFKAIPDKGKFIETFRSI